MGRIKIGYQTELQVAPGSIVKMGSNGKLCYVPPKVLTDRQELRLIMRHWNSETSPRKLVELMLRWGKPKEFPTNDFWRSGYDVTYSPPGSNGQVLTIENGLLVWK